MRQILLRTALVAAFAMAAPAIAADAPAGLKNDALIKSSDGRLLGRVDRVTKKDGVPVTASVIVNGRFVKLPAATISEAGGALVTSLTWAEVSKMK